MQRNKNDFVAKVTISQMSLLNVCGKKYLVPQNSFERMVFIATTHEYEAGPDKKLIRERRMLLTVYMTNLSSSLCRKFPHAVASN